MAIDPEIVDEENENIQKESDGKKFLAWVLMVFAIVYGISPIDIVPDIPIVGWIDDFMIATVAFANLIQQQFCQANTILNNLFSTIKWILVGLAVTIILIAILIITLIVKK